MTLTLDSTVYYDLYYLNVTNSPSLNYHELYHLNIMSRTRINIDTGLVYMSRTLSFTYWLMDYGLYYAHIQPTVYSPLSVQWEWRNVTNSLLFLHHELYLYHAHIADSSIHWRIRMCRSEACFKTFSRVWRDLCSSHMYNMYMCESVLLMIVEGVLFMIVEGVFLIIIEHRSCCTWDTRDLDDRVLVY